MGRTMLSKYLIQFSVVGWIRLGPNYGKGNGSDGNLLQKDLCQVTKSPRTVTFSAPEIQDNNHLIRWADIVHRHIVKFFARFFCKKK